MSECTHTMRREMRTWGVNDPANQTGKHVVLEICEQCRRFFMMADGEEVSSSVIELRDGGIRLAP